MGNLKGKSQKVNFNGEGDIAQAEALVVGDHTISSRLLVGTSGYPNLQVLMDALSISKTDLVSRYSPAQFARCCGRESA